MIPSKQRHSCAELWSHSRLVLSYIIGAVLDCLEPWTAGLSRRGGGKKQHTQQPNPTLRPHLWLAQLSSTPLLRLTGVTWPASPPPPHRREAPEAVVDQESCPARPAFNPLAICTSFALLLLIQPKLQGSPRRPAYCLLRTHAWSQVLIIKTLLCTDLTRSGLPCFRTSYLPTVPSTPNRLFSQLITSQDRGLASSRPG